MWRKFTIAKKLWTMAFISSFFLILSVLLGYQALNKVSDAAWKMGQGKDVVADILPPPLYLVEAQLIALQLQDAQGAAQQVLIDRLSQLKRDYDTRNAYWERSDDITEEVKSSLLGKQRSFADEWWMEVDRQYIPSIKAGNVEQSNASLYKLNHLYTEHREGVDRTVNASSLFAENALSGLHKVAKSTKAILLEMSLIGIVISTLVAFFVIDQIRSSLETAGKIAQKIASGNLSQEVMISSEDEVGQLMTHMARMSESLNTLVGDIHKGVERIRQHSLELKGAAANGAAVAEGQSEASSSMAASVEQLSVSVDQVEESAGDARRKVQESAKTANESARVIEDSALEMRQISEMVTESANNIRTLEAISCDISNIVDVIHEVADQTNLLALNAAIEAARAGEHGRGFAVVADEVRKLAERTSRSSTEITQMIAKIQGAAQISVNEMENGVERVSYGVQLSAAAKKSVLNIRETQAQVASHVDQISMALKEQASATREIAKKVEHLSQGTEQLAATAMQTSWSAVELAKQAQYLDSLTSRFQLK